MDVHTKASNASKAPPTFHVEDICLSSRNCTPSPSRVSLMWLSKGRMLFDSRHSSTESDYCFVLSLDIATVLKIILHFDSWLGVTQAVNGESMNIRF